MTDFDEIKRMLDLMDERSLEEFELERDGLRVRLRKHFQPVSSQQSDQDDTEPQIDTGSVVSNTSAGTVDDEHVLVKSPIVGMFYRSPDPGSAPFVEVGSHVHKGQVLCIIEAMKLMNEIDADQDGEIVKVYLENGQPVQYGETLFAIKPA